MKLNQLILATCVAACGSAFASSTLNFNLDSVSVPQNFANSSGFVTNGLYMGVIIDAGGNGFSSGALTYAPPTAVSTTYVLSLGGLAVDDVLVLGNYLTYDTVDAGGGPGGFYDVGPVAYALTAAGVSPGDAFRIIWFADQAGAQSTGTLSDATFLMPADGGLYDFTAPFVGVDPVRTAGLAYTGTTGGSTTPSGITLTAVPEPSAMLLGALGVLGLLRRRRN